MERLACYSRLSTHLIHPSPTAEGLRLGENGE